MTVVSLADFGVRRRGHRDNPKRDDPKSVQCSLDLLNRAQSFHEPTRAFFFVRGQAHRVQDKTAAANEDIKRHAEAIQLFTGCIALRPDHVWAYQSRAECHEKLGQMAEAEADLTAAIAAASRDLRQSRELE